MQFKKTTKRADQIGSDLGVSHLLAGSLRRTGSRIRIAVQLIDTETESQLWSDQYERDGLDLLALQRDVAEAITRQITTSLGIARSTVSADARRHSTSAEAYEHYLRGRHHVWGTGTAEGFEKARERFQRAIDLDDSYAHASVAWPMRTRCSVPQLDAGERRLRRSRSCGASQSRGIEGGEQRAPIRSGDCVETV